jgi:hypothetical protein
MQCRSLTRRTAWRPRAAGMRAVGVASDEATRERLLSFGADVAVARLVDLLDRRLVALAA